MPLFFTCSMSFIMSLSNINLRSLLEANKLTGANYIDWLRNLKIVLRSEKLGYVLKNPYHLPLLGMPLLKSMGHT